MKKTSLLLICIAALASSAMATVSVGTDTAPNVYGSPNWAPWWADAKANLVAGTFVNMGSGENPGTLIATPYEEIVYSAGDLGLRLHSLYWIPDTTIANLTDKFQVRTVFDWDGVDYVYLNGYIDNPTSEDGWVTPTKWEEYEGGVIGSQGWAWWAMGADGQASTVTQADIDALADEVGLYTSYVDFQVRYRTSSEDAWTVYSQNVSITPEPATMTLLGLGAVALVRRKK